MLGIATRSQRSQGGDKVSSQISNLLSGKIGDSDINITKLRNEFENKYLQKTSYAISDVGVVTQQNDFITKRPLNINDAISKFESGEVYEVLYKDPFGKYLPFLRTK